MQLIKAQSPGQKTKNIGKYTILKDRLLGEGAYGRVYLCYPQKNPAQFYACKIIKTKNDKETSDTAAKYAALALQRECAIHQELKHPNIVNMIDMEKTANNTYIIQEYCDGPTLQYLINERKKFPQRDAYKYIKEICLGFSALVKKGVIHRDLKPANIMFAGEHIKLGDFGYAKSINSQKEMNTSAVGTPLYMAPQVLAGKRYSSKCDVWSFGIIAYQLLYGRTPWHSQVPMSQCGLYRKIKTQPLIFPEDPSVHECFKQLIEDCLKIDQENRLSWLQVFEHNIFQNQPELIEIAQWYYEKTEYAITLLSQLAQTVKSFQLVGSFLQFKVPALDLRHFRRIMKHLFKHIDLEQDIINLMYQTFDKDANGVIDLEQFLKQFEVCNSEIPKILNYLVTHEGMYYKQMLDHYQFTSHALNQREEFDRDAIEEAYRVICRIQYTDDVNVD